MDRPDFGGRKPRGRRLTTKKGYPRWSYFAPDAKWEKGLSDAKDQLRRDMQKLNTNDTYGILCSRGTESRGMCL